MITKVLQRCSFRSLNRFKYIDFPFQFLSFQRTCITMIGTHSRSNQTAAASAKLVIVEGNIGVGKSTLACQLARMLNFRVFLEPTTKNPYLAKFYQDPNKYALKLQLWIFKQRFRTYVEATKHLLKTGQGVLLDRSVFSDAVFAEVNYLQGTISHEGYEYYKELNKQALEAVLVPHITLYLDVAPEACHQRIHGRGRDYESGIPLRYLQGLESSYNKFLGEMRVLGSSVMVYNWLDFGYKFDVAKDVSRTLTSLWDQEQVQNFTKLMSNNSLVKETLSLRRSIPEATISEDEDEPDSAKVKLQWSETKQKDDPKSQRKMNLIQQPVSALEG